MDLAYSLGRKAYSFVRLGRNRPKYLEDWFDKGMDVE